MSKYISKRQKELVKLTEKRKTYALADAIKILKTGPKTKFDPFKNLVLDEYAELKLKYGKYRNSIGYIDNNLNSNDGLIQIVKDKCAALGYYF